MTFTAILTIESGRTPPDIATASARPDGFSEKFVDTGMIDIAAIHHCIMNQGMVTDPYGDGDALLKNYFPARVLRVDMRAETSQRAYLKSEKIERTKPRALN